MSLCLNKASRSPSKRSQVEAPARADVDVWQLPRGAHKLTASTVEASQRGRICFGLVKSVADKGYSATTIADICALAKVSRSTFYKLFGDKETAYLAAYDVAHYELVDRVVNAQDYDANWNARMRATLSAYLQYNRDNPAAARALLVEIHAVGAAAWARRDWGHEQFARMQKGLYRLRRQEQPGLPELPDEVFLAVVAALEEMVSSHVRHDRTADMLQLLPRAMFLVEAIYGAGPHAIAELQAAQG